MSSFPTAAQPDLTVSWPFIADTSDPTELNTSGSTCANVAGAGLVAFQGKWAYFSNQVDEGRLYKIEYIGPPERQKICDGSASCINVIGDTLCYRNDSDGGALYSTHTDGEERTKLGDVWCEFVSVEGGWIYFGTG